MNTVPVNGSFTVDGNNIITTSQSRIGDPRFAQFTFQTAPNITWWKAIKIFDGSDQMVCLLETEDQDHGPKASRFLRVSPPFDSNAVIKIEIWKAKLLGAHTHVDTVYFKKNECVSGILYWPGKTTRKEEAP